MGCACSSVALLIFLFSRLAAQQLPLWFPVPLVSIYHSCILPYTLPLNFSFTCSKLINRSFVSIYLHFPKIDCFSCGENSFHGTLFHFCWYVASHSANTPSKYMCTSIDSSQISNLGKFLMLLLSIMFSQVSFLRAYLMRTVQTPIVHLFIYIIIRCTLHPVHLLT